MSAPPSKNRSGFNLLPNLAFLGTVLACVALSFPVVFFFITPQFEWKILLTIAILLICIERFWFSLFTSKNKNPTQVQQDWTFVAVGLSYTFMMLILIVELYFLYERLFLIPLFCLGLVFFIISITVRYWAVKTLGDQWAIHVEGQDKTGRRLVKTGPYGLARHPIYAAAILEFIGIPLIFRAYYALAFSVLICIPLVVKRASFEEKNSITIFGDEYLDYMKTTSAFWPLRKSKHKRSRQATHQK